MPVTRSKGNGRSLISLLADSETTSPGERSSGQEDSTTANTRTSVTGDTAETTTATSTTTTTTATTISPAKQTCPAAPPSMKSTKTTSSRRTLRIAHAKEELLRVKLELAQARIAVLEAESDDDGATVLSAQSNKRIDEWLESSQHHILALTEMPHNEQEHEPTPPPPVQRDTPHKTTVNDGQGHPHAAEPLPPVIVPPGPATAERVGKGSAPLSAAAPPFKPAQPYALYTEKPSAPPCKNSETATTEKAIVAANQVNLSELASAIAIAARAGHTTRYHAELPPFSGAHEEWLSFKAAYEETKTTYAEIENVSRLRRCLKGKAKEAVENLLIYHGSCEEIIKTLESRFGRPDSIALNELARLRALPRLSDGPRDICTFACRVANTIATLRALNRSQYLYSPETMKAVTDKLTSAQRYRWYDYAASHQSDEPELVKISSFLQREADYCAPYAPPESHDFTGLPQQSRRIHKTFAAVEKPISKCSCCNADSHRIEKCPKFNAEPVDERWKIAKIKRLCFRCLRYRNKTHFCKREKCDQDNCEHFHHRLLHYVKPKEVAAEAVTSTWLPRNPRAYLKIVPIEVRGPAGVESTLALLDDGSTVTLIDEAIAQRVGLDGPTEPLQIEAIADQRIDAAKSRRVTLHIRGHDGEMRICARTMSHLRLSPQAIRDDDLDTCEHLRDIQDYLKYEAQEPRILIGQDNWDLLTTQEIRRGKPGQPVASLTPLGWVLHGTNARLANRRTETSNHIVQHDDDVDKRLAEYFTIENLLIEPKRPQNDLEQQALTQLVQSTRRTPIGNYEVPLLWKKEDAKMPDNYENTLKRLHNIEQKLDKNEALKKKI